MKYKIILLFSLLILAIGGYSQGMKYSTWVSVSDTSVVLERTLPSGTLYVIEDMNRSYLSDAIFYSGNSVGTYWANLTEFPSPQEAIPDTLTWLMPVISLTRGITCNPLDTGARYIADTTLAPWTKNNIYECTGSGWSSYVPMSGDAVTVIDSSNIFIFNGSDWVAVTESATHWAVSGNNLFNLNTGNTGIGTGGVVNYKLEVNGDIGIKENEAIKWSGTKDNIILGDGAGVSLTAGVYNIFEGFEAGKFNLSGSNNIFNGYKAGYSNTIGSYNFFNNYQAGYSNTTGSYNFFNGYQAGYSNTTGENNFFNGYKAGYSNITGGRNFIVGYLAGTGVLGNSYSNNIFIGYSSGYRNTTGNGNVFMGSSSGLNNNIGSNNIFQGAETGLSNTTGSYNIFQSKEAGYSNTVGEYNTFQSYRAGRSNTTGSYNYFNGRDCGYFNTTGTGNYFVGRAAGLHNVNGNYNIYIGYQSGTSCVLGNSNIFLGYQSGYNEMGSNKLYIENSNADSTGALIYGDFAIDYLRFNADSVEINGFLRTDSVIAVSNTYADYVFEDNYILPTWEDQVAYWNEHKSLPSLTINTPTYNVGSRLENAIEELEKLYRYNELLELRVKHLESKLLELEIKILE